MRAIFRFYNLIEIGKEMRPPVIEGIKLTPYWWEEAHPQYIEAALVPANADIGIIGGGFAGMMAALTLARAGRDVVVFEAMRPGEGASTRNGGIASGNVKHSFSSLIKSVGIEKAKEIFLEGIEARKSLIDFVKAENIDCDLQLVGRFDGANHRRDYEALGEEADLLNKHVNFGAQMISQSEQHNYIGTDLYCGGRFRPDIAGVHPGKLYREICSLAVSAGVTIINKTAVSHIDTESSNFILKTPYGKTMVSNCIIATNGYTNEVTEWLRRRIIPIPSQIIATEPLTDELMKKLMPKMLMVGDTRNLYNYYRPSPDKKRIIFGGRRGADSDDESVKCRHLYNNLVEIFPDLEGLRLTHAWWGYTGYSFDFFPHVTIHNNIHYATAFCGSGVVWATWLGRKVAQKVLGNKDQSKTVFFSRKFPTVPFYKGNPWFVPLVIKWYGLKDKFMYGRRY